MEERILSGVGRFIERLVDKWDAMPEEKQDEVIDKIQTEIRKSRDREAGIEVNDERSEKREKSLSRVRSGLFFGISAGVLFYFTGGWFWFAVMLMLGIMPLTRGAVRLAQQRITSWRQNRERPRLLESRILRLAARAGGSVTVVSVASSGEVTLDEAQRALDAMTTQGYAEMRIRDDGVVLYEFPEMITR